MPWNREYSRLSIEERRQIVSSRLTSRANFFRKGLSSDGGEQEPWWRGDLKVQRQVRDFKRESGFQLDGKSKFCLLQSSHITDSTSSAATTRRRGSRPWRRWRPRVWRTPWTRRNAGGNARISVKVWYSWLSKQPNLKSWIGELGKILIQSRKECQCFETCLVVRVRLSHFTFNWPISCLSTTKMACALRCHVKILRAIGLKVKSYSAA